MLELGVQRNGRRLIDVRSYPRGVRVELFERGRFWSYKAESVEVGQGSLLKIPGAERLDIDVKGQSVGVPSDYSIRRRTGAFDQTEERVKLDPDRRVSLAEGAVSVHTFSSSGELMVRPLRGVEVAFFGRSLLRFPL